MTSTPAGAAGNAEQPIHWHRDGARLNRRQVLGWLSASAALASGACSQPDSGTIHPYVHMPEAGSHGRPIHYASGYVRDGYALGVLLGTNEGRPVKVEGNPLHPSSLGATDVFAQAAILELWDPDRSSTVRQRLGGTRGGEDAAPSVSSWAAFETEWRARTALRQEDGATAPTEASRAPGVARSQGPQRPRLHLVTGPLTSPSERALLAQLLAAHPGSRWHVHAPLLAHASAAGSQRVFGRALWPVLHLDRARCIAAFACDPFSDGPGAVRDAMDWEARRGTGRASGDIASLFAFEAVPGLFGARADVREPLSPVAIERVIGRLAVQFGVADAPPETAPRELPSAAEVRLWQTLRSVGRDAVLIGGRDLSPHAHALLLALNQRLGGLGHTMHLIEPPHAAPGTRLEPSPRSVEAGDLGTLARALRNGEVDLLLVLGVNPLYESPRALGLANAWRHAGLSVHAGLYVDETAAACDWHLPLSHDFERWGDALAHDGSATLLQPAIAPLYDSRSMAELLALLAGDAERDGRALLRRHWRTVRGKDSDAAFEDFWRSSLRRGVIDATASDPAELPAAQRLAAAAPSLRPSPTAAMPDDQASLVAVFPPDPAVHDGRYANLGWLQELPRPFTKLTWDNALQLGPQTAARLGLSTGDVARAQSGARTLDAPVWVSSRQAEGVAVLPLGHGRTNAGRVGSGIGFNAWALRPHDGSSQQIRIEATGRRHDFAVTQHRIEEAGREIARVLPSGGRIADAGFEHPGLYAPQPDPEHAWAMSIDLDACIGCNACTIACQAENNIPVVGRDEVARGREMHWIRIDRYDSPEAGNSVFQPVPCMHCEQAPCELVCPVGATLHDSEGLNVQVYNRCIGTRFCSNNCPYKVRRFNFLKYVDDAAESLKGQRNPDVTVRARGVMEKCSYCLQRITRARHHAEVTGTPLVDGDVVTACQAVCPTRAIRFGDLRDPGSDVARQKASPRHYALLGELNTRPRTTYLARIAPG